MALQLYSLCERSIVSISAGKYWSAAVTAAGDVYMWDGKKGMDKPPVPTRLHGVKRATSISVGETHLLIVGSLYHPTYPASQGTKPQNLKSDIKEEMETLDEGFLLDDIVTDENLSSAQIDDPIHRPVPSLKSLCEKVAAESIVEPRNAIQLLEIADSLEADGLRKHCEVLYWHQTAVFMNDVLASDLVQVNIFSSDLNSGFQGNSFQYVLQLSVR